MNGQMTGPDLDACVVRAELRWEADGRWRVQDAPGAGGDG